MKPGSGVVVVGVDHARPRLAEHVEVHGVAIALQEDQVVGVDGPDGVHQPAVDRHDALLARIVRLVDRVVARHPRIVPVASRDRFPDADRAILEMLVLPEERLVRRVVGVPIHVLIARQRMQVDDRVDAVRRAQVDGPIQVLEPLLLDDERRHVVFEVAVVDRDADQVQPQRLDEAGVVLGEEVGEEAVEEERVLLRAERLEQAPGAAPPRWPDSR